VSTPPPREARLDFHLPRQRTLGRQTPQKPPSGSTPESPDRAGITNPSSVSGGDSPPDRRLNRPGSERGSAGHDTQNQERIGSLKQQGSRLRSGAAQAIAVCLLLAFMLVVEDLGVCYLQERLSPFVVGMTWKAKHLAKVVMKLLHWDLGKIEVVDKC